MVRDVTRREASLHANPIVIARSRNVPHGGLGHGQTNTALLELAIAGAQRANQIGARDLAPDQIVRVIHDAHLIGFRVAYAQLGGRFGNRRHRARVRERFVMHARSD